MAAIIALLFIFIRVVCGIREISVAKAARSEVAISASAEASIQIRQGLLKEAGHGNSASRVVSASAKNGRLHNSSTIAAEAAIEVVDVDTIGNALGVSLSDADAFISHGNQKSDLATLGVRELRKEAILKLHIPQGSQCTINRSAPVLGCLAGCNCRTFVSQCIPRTALILTNHGMEALDIGACETAYVKILSVALLASFSVVACAFGVHCFPQYSHKAQNRNDPILTREKMGAAGAFQRPKSLEAIAKLNEDNAKLHAAVSTILDCPDS